jgi:hypothetical protein
MPSLHPLLMAAGSLLLVVSLIVLAVRLLGSAFRYSFEIEDLNREIADLEQRLVDLEATPAVRSWMTPVTRWRMRTRLGELRRRRVHLLESWSKRQQRKQAICPPTGQPPRSTAIRADHPERPSS